MDSTYCKKINILTVLAGVSVVLASVFLLALNSQAQTSSDTNFDSAIQDLNSATGQNFTTKEQAGDLCNQEQYWEICADIGKRHNLYTLEEINHVDDFLSEVKGKILDDIKNCSSEECLVRVASELALKIKTKNPTLATDLSLTTKIVAEKQAVIQAAKEVGVNFKDCE